MLAFPRRKKKKTEKSTAIVLDAGVSFLMFAPRKKHLGLEFFTPFGKATGG